MSLTEANLLERCVYEQKYMHWIWRERNRNGALVRGVFKEFRRRIAGLCRAHEYASGEDYAEV
jgi:hypothetical protein